MTPPPALVTRLWRSRVVLSITAVFSTGTICTYAGFAWLPEILVDLAGSTPTEAGLLLAVTGLVSVPGALVAPLLVARLRSVGWLIAAGSGSFVVGYLGPLLVGLLHDVTGGWTLPLVLLLAVALVASVPAIALSRPAFVEDELVR